jgi:hypothetical protein
LDVSPVTSRAYAIRWLSAVGFGIALGVATAWIDVRAGGLEQDGLWRAASMVLNSGSAWAALAVVGGWLIGRPLAGAVAGTVALVAAVVGYYAFGVLVGDRTDVGFAGVSGAVRMWALLAIVVGPVLGLAGALVHRPGLVGFVAVLVVPIGIVVEMLGIRKLNGTTFDVDPALAWAQAMMVAAAVLGAGSALVLRLRQPANQPRDVLGTAGTRRDS